MKANKTHLKLQAESFERLFINISNWDNFKEQFTKFKEEMKGEYMGLEKKFETFRDYQKDTIENECDIIVNSKFTKFNDVYREFSKFFNKDALSV